ncbi:MAG: transporter substrate-binding domain-containing protein [Candidatus Brocadiaceae bacterium]|nr:transporter substrate-binding domain-containing protein [Candidatus Brocadiaceae bacterium]
MNRFITTITTLIIAFTIFPYCVLADAPQITLVATEWEPHMSEDLKNNGYFSDATSEIFRKMGYDPKVIFLPWPRALKIIKEGTDHILLGAYYNKSRAEFYEYSDAITSEDIYFFSKKGKQINYSSLKDLSKYTIGLVRSASYGSEFDNADFLVKEPVLNDVMNVKKLVYDRIDLLISSKISVQYILKHRLPEYKDQLQIIKPKVRTSNMYITVSKKRADHITLIRDFNKKLKQLKEDGSLNKIIKKHSIP